MSATLHPPSSGDIDIGWKLEVGTTVTFLCAAIVVALRCFTRWKFANRGWDDYLMVFAFLQALVATILDFIAVNDGLGRHAYYLAWSQDVNQEYYSLLAQVFCVQALSFAKLSIVVSYMRVLRGSGNRFHQVVLWTVGILVLAVNTMVVITFYASCSPNEKAWNPEICGTCWTTDKKLGFVILQGAFSAFSDFFLAHYPIVFLNRLPVKLKMKVFIFGLMRLGVLTGVFAVIRTVESATELHLSPEEVPDVSYSTVMGLMWSGMERNIAILIGSVPALTRSWHQPPAL